MFFKTLVTKWEGVGRCTRIPPHAVGHYYVFNINNVTQLKEYGTGSEFIYVDHPQDRKTGYSKIQCATSYFTIRSEFDVPPISNILELSVFENKNPNKEEETIYINIADFSYAWAHNPYPQYSWLRYCLKGGKDKYVLVNMTLDELLELDFVFDETNIQWYFFVDPDELIHPTWFIRVNTMEDVDGNIYRIGTIGTQTWMLENLRTTKYKDGTSIPNLTDAAQWAADTAGAYAWYNNDISYKDDYGALYNWYATDNIHGLAPDGWHIPTKAEYLVLLDYIGGTNHITIFPEPVWGDYPVVFYDTAGGVLKETGFDHWDLPNTGATNDYNFSAVGAGARIWEGSWGTDLINKYNVIWGDSYNPPYAYAIYLAYSSTQTSIGPYVKEYGYSVRCIKD